MKRVLWLFVYMLAVLAVQQSARGGDEGLRGVEGGKPQGDAPVGFVPSPNSLAKFAPKRSGDSIIPPGNFNGFAGLRSQPESGLPGTGGFGHRHYAQPMDRYTTWYRPRAATLTRSERCAPDAWRPRGLGHLFAEPLDSFRMDYEPYSLGEAPSTYGPAYVNRLGDPRCPNCCEQCKEKLKAGQCAKCGRRH